MSSDLPVRGRSGVHESLYAESTYYWYESARHWRAEAQRLRERLESCERHYRHHASDDYGAWVREEATAA